MSKSGKNNSVATDTVNQVTDASANTDAMSVQEEVESDLSLASVSDLPQNEEQASDDARPNLRLIQGAEMSLADIQREIRTLCFSDASTV